MNQEKVSVIIPAYNEEKTIEKVVTFLLSSSLVDEIICINDGSKDSTEEILKQFGNKIIFINLKQNKGKGNALAQGIKIAKGDIVIFLDADLVTLSDEHIHLLLEPLRKKTHRAVIGYLIGKIGFNIFSEISGQRAYYKADLLPHTDEMIDTRFGIEMFLNGLFSEKETKKIPLPKLRGLFKYEKQDGETAIKEYIQEGIEIAKVIANKEILPKGDSILLKEISAITDMKGLKESIAKIKNKRIKNILEKYILKYLLLSEKQK